MGREVGSSQQRNAHNHIAFPPVQKINHLSQRGGAQAAREGMQKGRACRKVNAFRQTMGRSLSRRYPAQVGGHWCHCAFLLLLRSFMQIFQPPPPTPPHPHPTPPSASPHSPPPPPPPSPLPVSFLSSACPAGFLHAFYSFTHSRPLSFFVCLFSFFKTW